jgi:hypothetical protein
MPGFFTTPASSSQSTAPSVAQQNILGGIVPTPQPVLIKSKDWVTNRQIKIPILENNCSTAAFRVWHIKFEKYLAFTDIVDIWNQKFEDRPETRTGDTQLECDQWIECDNLIGQLLSTAVGENKIADGYVAQTYADPWRKTWGLIKQHFMPCGNNATAIQAGKVSGLWRRNDETFRQFIRRIDTEMAFLKSLGGEQPDYVLNGLLSTGADPDMKTAVILGVASNQSYDTIRDQLLMVLPHPAQNNSDGTRQAKSNSVQAVIGKSGGKSKSKFKNQNRNSNEPYSKDGRKRCPKCRNLGHSVQDCKTDMSKKCTFCGKMGHLSPVCRKGQSCKSADRPSEVKFSSPSQQFQPQSHNVNQNPAGNQTVYYTMEPVNPPQQNTYVPSPVSQKSVMKTVTFNPGTQSGVNFGPPSQS